MREPVDVRDLERRATKYWHADGLPELVMGLLWIVWGAAWLVGQALPRGPVWNIFWMFTPAALALTGVAAVWVTKRLKARVTFPRAGYVEWKGPTAGQRLTAAAIAVVAAMVVVVLARKSRIDGMARVAVPGLGVLLSLSFVAASITQRAPHLLALAGVALALGLAGGALGAGWDAMNWMFVLLGAATALVGALRLAAFLRRHPPDTHGD